MNDLEIETKQPEILLRAIPYTVLAVSIVQGIQFLLTGIGTTLDLILAWFVAVNIFVAMRLLVVQRTRLLAMLLILYGAQLGVFLSSFFSKNVGSPTIAENALLAMHLAIVTFALLVTFQMVSALKAIGISLLICAGFLMFQLIPGFHPTNRSSADSPQWVGSVDPHPQLGMIYHPYSVLKTVYPYNPRAYFWPEDRRESLWWLRSELGNVAHLTLPPDRPELVRITIDKTQTKTAYDIQANFSHLEVKSKHQYTVQFRARSDRPRKLFIGVSRSHDRYDNLGLYREIQLTEEWKSFHEDFTAASDDPNARIHFDVGENDVSIDLDSVRLLSQPGAEFVPPGGTPPNYFVRYRFNALGCRGEDSVIPRPAGTERILILGDSYALGVGVHEPDTLSNQLAQLLNPTNAAGTTKHYEVINCGVNGYGTEQERLFYELIAAKYQPTVVLLVATLDDDIFDLAGIKEGQIYAAWPKAKDYGHNPVVRNFSKCLKEMLLLNQKVRENGGKLFVAIFRNDPDYAGSGETGKNWNKMIQTISTGVQKENIPVLDLGKALYAHHSQKELMVHPVIDNHPNEMAQAIAAREIAQFLQK